MRIESDLTLMMTASIRPVRGMEAVGLTRVDPKLREQDYLDALTFFLTKHPRLRRITFVENSGADLEGLRRAVRGRNPHGKQVEFVSLDCNTHPAGWGGGYGEWNMMAAAMAQSPQLAQSRYVAKMTGRQWLTNLTALVAPLDDFDFYCDTQDSSLYELLGLSSHGRTRKVDARFWVTTPKFFQEHVQHLHRGHEDGIWFAEPALYEMVRSLPPSCRVVPRFVREPVIRGIAGHMNKNYGGAKVRVKSGVRGLTRAVFPDLWI